MILSLLVFCSSWVWALGAVGGAAQSLPHAIAFESAANAIAEATQIDRDIEDAAQLRIIHPSTKLYKYQAYKDISILHFNIPEDTGKAVFTFKANTIGTRCSPEDITIYLKFGSFPVISVENIPFPQHFLNETERPKIHHTEFKANNDLQIINITNPLPGDWFGIAFISYTDPKHDKIEQQGIAASCETKLVSELSILLGRIPEIKFNQNYSFEIKNDIDRPLFLNIPEDYDEVEIAVESFVECSTCELTLKLHNFTYINDSVMTDVIEEKFTLENKTNVMKFDVDNKSSYYLDINIKEPSMSIANFSVNLQLNTIINESAASNFQFDAFNPGDFGFDEYPLVRQTFSELFKFDYSLVPDENGTTPPMLNITGEKPLLLKFPIYAIHDIGGTLTVGVNLKIDTDRYQKGSNFDFQQQINYTLLGCLRRDGVGFPQLPNTCIYEDIELPATINVNNSMIESSMGTVHVPYPEPGNWHILFRLFCDNVKLDEGSLKKLFLTNNLKQLQHFNKDCECYELAMNCTQNSTFCSNLTDAEVQKLNQCLFNPFCSNNFINLTTDFRLMKEKNGVCETSFTFSISSSPCIGGKCSPYGICLGNRNGGFLYSTCVCFRNYRGWDCFNGDEALSSNQLLLDILLLTLSNLLFVGSTIYAIRERYFTEAIVYAFTCFFSTFYHACDAGEDIYSFCIVKLSVLQFSDFYCGLLSIWVTLVAMANLKKHKYKSILHMLGCVLLAFGTQLDKTSLWVFLMPAVTGLLLVFVAWSLQYRRRRKCHLRNRYWKIFLPIGFVTVAVGLACYAFLQTNDNYSIIHSCWHLIMALSIILLLPSRNSFIASSLTDNNLIENNQFENELPISNPERMVENNLLDNNISTIHQRNNG